MLASFIERLLAARTIPDIQEVFLAAVASMGFDHALYAAQFMLSVPRSLVRDSPVVLSNLPGTILDQIDQWRMDMLDQDPLTGWVHDNDAEITARDLMARHGPSPLLQLAARHGHAEVQILSLRDKVLHSVGAVMVSPGPGADAATLQTRWHACGREVRVLSWVMHMRIATMHRTKPTATLTPRQREVLGWRSAGKTVGEIATILGITPATVEKHMRLARDALGVETTPQAVLKAHVTHQLFLPGPVKAGGPR